MNFESRGYILHQRKSKESSAILSCFTEKYGKICASVPRLLSSSRKERLDLPLLRPLRFEFCKKSSNSFPYIIHAWIENGVGGPQTINLQFSGLYLNELLFKLLEEDVAYPKLYHIYDKLLGATQGCPIMKENIREFEWILLESLGYSIGFPQEICTDKNYYFDPSRGEIVDSGAETPSKHREQILFLSGRTAEQLKKGCFSDPEISKAAKIIFLRQLRWHTPLEQLHSLELFSQWSSLKA